MSSKRHPPIRFALTSSGETELPFVENAVTQKHQSLLKRIVLKRLSHMFSAIGYEFLASDDWISESAPPDTADIGCLFKEIEKIVTGLIETSGSGQGDGEATVGPDLQSFFNEHRLSVIGYIHTGGKTVSELLIRDPSIEMTATRQDARGGMTEAEEEGYMEGDLGVFSGDVFDLHTNWNFDFGYRHNSEALPEDVQSLDALF